LLIFIAFFVFLWILGSIDLKSLLPTAIWCGVIGVVILVVFGGWMGDGSPSAETSLTESSLTGTMNQPSAAPSIPIPEQKLRPTFNPTNSGENYYRTFEWSYENTKWTYSMGVSKDAYEYYRARPHNRENDYSQYALSDYDRAYIQGIVNKFEEGGQQKGCSNYDNVMMIVSFVQSLPYTSDSVSTGYDDYPRYPLETLVDNGGDCEDTAILTAALLREMGYGAVLIQLPGHMAVGVKCSDNFQGTYYEYQGARYYYLETTGEGFGIGVIPDKYRNVKAQILPMIQTPRMSISMNAEYAGCDNNHYYYRGFRLTRQNVHLRVENPLQTPFLLKIMVLTTLSGPL